MLAGYPDKIPQQLQPDALAFFRVELRRENIVPPNCRRKRFAISGSGRNDRRISRLRKKAMDEINETTGGNAAEKRALRLRDLKLVPANLRDF